MTYQEYKQAIANKINNRLVELGMQRQEFAELMNVSPPRITKWLRGDHNFTVNTLMKIEYILSIKLLSYD